MTHKGREKLTQDSNALLHKRKIKSFYHFVEENSFSRGVKSMIQVIIN
jgi:hypothetical protein